MRLATTDRHLSVRVANEDWDGLRRIADESAMTVSALVREVIEVFLDAEHRAAQEAAGRFTLGRGSTTRAPGEKRDPRGSDESVDVTHR